MSSKSITLSLVSKAVAVALNEGYQVSPDAVKLLQGYAEKKARKDHQPSLDFIISEVLENKAKSKGVPSKTIVSEDLFRVFPDLFESGFLIKSEKKVVETIITPSAFTESKVEKVKQENAVESSLARITSEIEVIKDPSKQVRPTGTEGFAQLFKNRYEKLNKIFQERPEGRQVVKIDKLNMDKGTAKISGLVFSKKPTKNGIEISIDDDSGRASVLALNEEVRRAAASVSLDQCVLLDVEAKQGRLILKNIIQPDVPSRVSSTSKKTVYAVFLSDLHIGSNKFLEGAFDRFILWLRGEWHNSGQKEDDEEIISKLKYVVIGGDVVDGVGVFPNQEYELAENNIYKQYEMVAQKLSKFPEHLQMLVIPGNHDSTRQALPQPMIPEKYAGSLYKLKNLTMLGDPSVVRLHGVSILVYHGRSLDDVLATTPGLSYEEPAEAMKVLLRARHLAPMFGSRTPIAPEAEDHLVIEEVPDIFHAGHVHSIGVTTYKSTLIINSGTWQAQTGYQANLGITPSPGVVPIVNLATLDVVSREFLVSGFS